MKAKARPTLLRPSKGLTLTAHRLDPDKALLDALSDLLSHAIAGMVGGSPIDR